MNKGVLILLVALLALAAMPAVAGAGGPPGCLKGGEKFVGDLGLISPTYAGIFASINWTYPSGACTGGDYYAEGDSSVQIWKFPDGTWMHLVYVFTAEDLTDNGAVCEWDTVTDEEPCGDVTNNNLKYWLIHYNSKAEKFKATPAGRGAY